MTGPIVPRHEDSQEKLESLKARKHATTPNVQCQKLASAEDNPVIDGARFAYEVFSIH